MNLHNKALFFFIIEIQFRMSALEAASVLGDRRRGLPSTAARDVIELRRAVNRAHQHVPPVCVEVEDEEERSEVYAPNTHIECVDACADEKTRFRRAIVRGFEQTMQHERLLSGLLNCAVVTLPNSTLTAFPFSQHKSHPRFIISIV